MKKNLLWVGLMLFTLLSCAKREVSEIKRYPTLYPEYKFTTIPCNIAPLTFEVQDKDLVEAEYLIDDEVVFKTRCARYVKPSLKKWRKALQQAAGKRIYVRVTAREELTGEWLQYHPFYINVSRDSIDSHIAYRLIEPGYELWVNMGLYQRDLTTYTQKPIFENRINDTGCLNCHSFGNYSPQQFQFHSRKSNPGTLLVKGDLHKRLDLKADSTMMSGGVYPYWHPSGNFIAYSINQTRQLFHAYNRNKIEVYDEESDLIVYDIARNEVISSPLVMGGRYLETYPTWSPDGQWLYFCRANPIDIYRQPWTLKYGIYRIAFDPGTRTFGDSIETVIDEQKTGKTQLFPRISPDGRFLMYAQADYGYFSIWHKEANLQVYNLEKQRHISTSVLNSREVESYHAWSGNSRWVIFSSRRLDGLYTRLFIAHCDEKGNFSRPFLLPQEDPQQNNRLMKSYNIPEFVKGEVTISPYTLREIATGEVTKAIPKLPEIEPMPTDTITYEELKKMKQKLHQ